MASRYIARPNFHRPWFRWSPPLMAIYSLLVTFWKNLDIIDELFFKFYLMSLKLLLIKINIFSKHKQTEKCLLKPLT